MGLLDRLVEDYFRNVENVDRPLQQVQHSAQHPDIKDNKKGAQWEKREKKAKTSLKNDAKIGNDTKKIEVNLKNVEDVACVREGRESSYSLSPSAKIHKKPISQESLTRASNNFNISISGCDTCPACGHWDGYGPWKMLPGRYCFHTAYFKGKAARPVPVVKAQQECPRSDDDDE